ncbi:MAG: hypothetical protein ABIS28_04275 [Caldimonas sp.]
MTMREPIDPFLSELKLAQATGQRVLAAAAQRRPDASGARGRAQAQRSGELSMPNSRGPAIGGPAEQRAT